MTDKTKHTPGPWHVHTHKVEKPGDTPLISIRTMHLPGHHSRVGAEVARVNQWLKGKDANARLIAAAPELFEFAIQVLYSLGGGCRPDHDAAPYTREELIEMASDLVQRVDP